MKALKAFNLIFSLRPGLGREELAFPFYNPGKQKKTKVFLIVEFSGGIERGHFGTKWVKMKLIFDRL